MVTERDIAVLRALARYYVLSRGQIQRLCFEDDLQGRITRRRLQALVSASLISRHPLSVFNVASGTPGPAYFPSPKGLEILSEFDGNERYLQISTQTPQAHHLFHWLAISDVHIALDAAVARQDSVEIAGWLNEWDLCDRGQTIPEKRFRLYTLLRDNPRLVCAPDAAFLLQLRGHAKVFYLEVDRATSGVRQIAASKIPGYAEMAKGRTHLRHFSAATVPTFNVLMTAPTERRRDALRLALRGKPGAEFWKFATIADLSPERFLHDPVFYPCEGDPTPLVKPMISGPADSPHNSTVTASGDPTAQ